MDLYPAIDIRDGRCVRLRQGDYADETVYGDDPVAVAHGFVDAGARWIHVVDLDAARTGDGLNRPVVAAIAAAVAGRACVQTGGGVRSLDDVKALADAGVARVVMGTAAVTDPALVTKASGLLPIAVGLDHRRGEVAVHGWIQGSGTMLFDLFDRFESAAAFVITEIGRDGMLSGPDVDGLAEACRRTSISVIASGGVATLADLVTLGGIKGLGGVIVGKAIYECRFTVAEALQTLRRQ